MPRPTPSLSRRLALGAALPLVLAPGARADWRIDAGYTRLLETFTSGVPASVVGGLTLVEAGTNYLPNGADPRLAHVTLVNKSALSSGTSSHATEVALNFFGSSTSALSAPLTVDAYSATDWQGSGFLNVGTPNLPLNEARRVQNHSWISIYDRTRSTLAQIQASVENINRRLDYAIDRDGFVSVVGMNNGASNTLPDLLGQTYHTLSVGLVNGGHSAGLTQFDVAGRMKPDLVAFNSFTSFAAPQVASVAGVLSEKLRSGPAASSLVSADYPRLTKALLLAGAAKEPLSSWSRASSATPYDAVRGAGALNALLAYRILDAGPQAFASTATVSATGWSSAAVGTNGPNSIRSYFFDIPAGSAAAPFSAALVWHREIGTNLSVAMANLDLRLHAVAAGTFNLGAEIDASLSTVDNVEHLYRPALAPGRYALRVGRTAGGATDFALAWRSNPTVTVAATIATTSETDPAASAVFTVTRLGSTTSPLVVPLAWSGSAVFGSHYTAPASVRLPAGASSATVSVTPVADSLAQGNRGVTVSVASDFSLSAGTPASASATIQDKPFDAWRHARFSAAQLADPAVSGDTADPDGDGLATLLEYALGAEPLAPDSAARQPVVGTDAQGRLTLTYLHAAGRPDLAYAVEWTSDLAAGPTAWQTGAGIVTETARVPTEGGELVTVRAEATPASAPRQFLRLRVTRL